MTLAEDVVLGVTHLSIGGELTRLYKCPFCNFKNIHLDEIKHHIRYNDDYKHDVDADKIDSKQFLVPKKESKYTYTKKEDLPLPWIKCPWCDYKDKVERDLEYHILDNKKCRIRLYKMKVSAGERRRDPVWTRDPYSWVYDDTEYRLYKAMRLAMKKSGITK